MIRNRWKLRPSRPWLLQADLDAAIDAMPNAASRRSAKIYQARTEAAKQRKSWEQPRGNRKRNRQPDAMSDLTAAASHLHPSQVHTVRGCPVAYRSTCVSLCAPSKEQHLRTLTSYHRIISAMSSLKCMYALQALCWVATCEFSLRTVVYIYVVVKKVAHSHDPCMSVVIVVFAVSSFIRRYMLQTGRRAYAEELLQIASGHPATAVATIIC